MQPKLLNYNAKRIVQGGRTLVPLYNSMGLDGYDQIVGVADSGLDDFSCFFYDDKYSQHYTTNYTNRNDKLESTRRKVIQYESYADYFDSIGGHGTHVCGTIVGNSQSNFALVNGIAEEAKISFFDIGMSEADYLVIPELKHILDSAYDSGANTRCLFTAISWYLLANRTLL